jgi:AhpD family alkylhydroperoxidase
MEPRMTQPVISNPAAMQAMLALHKSTTNQGVPQRTLDLVNLRASQINGCSVCVDMHSKDLKRGGDTDERIFAVAAWRDTPWFTDAERAALALTECLTRLADHPDPVSDDLWAELGKHYDEAAIGALLLAIGAINVWNRLNAATRQVAGAYTG